MNQFPKVFLSYAHIDKDYEQSILKFANHLREEQGIDANVDLYEDAPAQGWPRWMEDQVNQSDYVLVFCSKTYSDKFYNRENGKGVKWEGALLYNHIYDMGTENTKFIPVYFHPDDLQYVLTPLKQYTHYCVSDQEAVNRLCLRIHGKAVYEKPPVRSSRSLPPKRPKSLFYSSPINLDLWNEAKWRGALYGYAPGKIPALGLVFTNLKAGEAIFSDWRESYGSSYVDDYVRIDFIVPPFPANNYVMKEAVHNYGKGYHIHIGPNVDKVISRIESQSKADPDDLHGLMLLSRVCWMNTSPGINHREAFIKAAREHGEFRLFPVGYANIPKAPEDYSGIWNPDDVIGSDSNGVLLRNVHVKAGVDLRRNRDLCSIVLKRPQ